MANIIGIDEKSLSSIETDRFQSVGLKTLVLASNVLGTTVNYFLGNDKKNDQDEYEYKDIKNIIDNATPDQRIFIMDLVRFILINKK